MHPNPTAYAIDGEELYKQLILKGNLMSKGNKRRGNREAKKPKKEKEKVVVTADFSRGKTPIRIGDSKK